MELPRPARRSEYRPRSAALTAGGSAVFHPSDPSLRLGGNRSPHRKLEVCMLAEGTRTIRTIGGANRSNCSRRPPTFLARQTVPRQRNSGLRTGLAGRGQGAGGRGPRRWSRVVGQFQYQRPPTKMRPAERTVELHPWESWSSAAACRSANSGFVGSTPSMYLHSGAWLKMRPAAPSTM